MTGPAGLLRGEGRWRLMALPVVVALVLLATGIVTGTAALILVAVCSPFAIALICFRLRSERRTRHYR